MKHSAKLHFSGRCNTQIGGHSMTRSGPLGAASSCNNTQAIQSWQRITSLLGQPQNNQYKDLSRTSTATNCNIWGSSWEFN